MTDAIDLRAFYDKTGRAKYISHLDVARAACGIYRAPAAEKAYSTDGGKCFD